MADDVDLASQYEMVFTDQAIERSQRRKHEPRGECHWCEERFPHGSTKIFCDNDCAVDYGKQRGASI